MVMTGVNQLLVPKSNAPAGLGINLLMPKDHGLKPYWLHARFTIYRNPRKEHLDDCCNECCTKFIADMKKQGWEYLDKHGIWYTGPLSPTPITGAPSRTQRERFNAKEAIDKVRAGNPMRPNLDLDWVGDVPDLAVYDLWEYDVKAAFVHKTILVERPDAHEELEVIRNR